jgi:hypothetical protein
MENNLSFNALIQEKINQLIDASKKNSISIKEQKELIEKLKKELLSQESNIIYKNNNLTNRIDQNLEELQKDYQENHANAIKHDCLKINSSIDSIKANITSENIDIAIQDAAKFVAQSRQLERRINYLKQIRQLIQLYENEKSTRQKLSDIAVILDITAPESKTAMPIVFKVLSTQSDTYINHNTQQQSSMKPKYLH